MDTLPASVSVDLNENEVTLQTAALAAWKFFRSAAARTCSVIKPKKLWGKKLVDKNCSTKL